METWQLELREGFRDMTSLLHFLEIPESLGREFFDSHSEFPIRVPRTFAQRMEKGNPFDPLFLQIMPQLQEQHSPNEFKLDAVGDLEAVKSKGVIQKYKGRVLLLMTGTCAVHCRYCFRRHFPYFENSMISAETMNEFLSQLKNDPSIEEVIFSGGDPLLLTNNKLFEWAQALTQIPTIKRWRIHSRLVSVLPARIDAGLIEVLDFFQKDNRKTILVNHINHPNEINEEVIEALVRLKKSEITLLNQSVLLKEINNDVTTLKYLSTKLFQYGVLPYYLHLLDRTKGTHHFEVEEEKARALHAELLACLPGYLVPKLVREVQGQPNKVLIL